MPVRPDKNGVLWEIDAQGNPVRPAQGGAFIPKAVDPLERQSKEIEIQAALARMQDIGVDNARSDREANKPPAGFMWTPAGTLAPIPGGPEDPNATGKSKTNAAGTQKLANLRALERQIAEVRELYRTTLKGGNPVTSLGEYLPTGQNKAFDSAGKALAETGFGAFRVPGVGSQSDAEGLRFVEAYAPSSWDQDAVVEQKLTNLENRLKDTYREMGIEPREVAPVPNAEKSVADKSRRNDVLFNDGGDESPSGGFVPYGGQSRTENNPQWKGVNDAVKGLITSNRPDEEIAAFLAARGINAAGLTGLQQAKDYFRKTGKTNFRVDVDDIEVPMSGLEQTLNNAPQTRAGTVAATYLNAAGMGLPSLVADEKIDYLREQEPGYALAGDVAGAISGTSLLGKVGATAAAKFAPAALEGGSSAAIARELAKDVTYGATTGATMEGDPLSGALFAAGGNLAGRGIANTASKVVAGGGTPAAQSLRQQGVPLTVGQALGGLPKRVENAATTIPFVGDAITNRYGEGIEAFNREAFRQGGAPIGAQVDDIGAAGIDQLKPLTGQAYDRATQGVVVPLDAQYADDLAPLLEQGRGLAGDYGAGFNRLVDNRVAPALDGGELTGANYQNMTRAMRDSRGSVQGQPFAEDYIDPVRGMEAATRALMERQGGQSVIDGLSVADEGYRNFKVLGKAVEAAKNQGEQFMPSQLNAASSANARKFGGNGATQDRPFYDLAMQGQETLPSKLGNSGTTERYLAGAGLLGTSTGGAAYLSEGDVSATAAPAALTIALSLLGSKGGQKALTSAIMDRPEIAKNIIGKASSEKTISRLLTENPSLTMDELMRRAGINNLTSRGGNVGSSVALALGLGRE